MVLLRGKPGIGKSRLAAALEEALTGERPPLWSRAANSSRAAGSLGISPANRTSLSRPASARQTGIVALCTSNLTKVIHSPTARLLC